MIKYSNQIDICQIPKWCEFEVKQKLPFPSVGKLNFCLFAIQDKREKFKPERKLFETEKASKIWHVNKFCINNSRILLTHLELQRNDV